MTHLYLRPILLLLIYIGIYTLVSAQPIRILPLGNSITQGSTEYPSYRYELWKQLIDEGVAFEFVGSHDVNNGGTPSVKGDVYEGETYTNINEGHWGWTTDEVLDELPGWLEGYTPDIVLLHLGTNDIFQLQEGSIEATIEKTLEEIRQVIEIIKGDNPNVVILLAQLIPTSLPNTDANEHITLFNAEMPALAASLNQDVVDYVYVVNQNTGFDPEKTDDGGDTYDSIHPNTSGELKMATNWSTAIQSAIVTLPVTLSGFSAVAAAAGQVQLHWSTAMEKDNAYFAVERSTDGVSFEGIGRVAGKGNSSVSISYSFLDATAPAGEVYYRLRQVDFDGTETLSAVVVARVRAGSNNKLSLYPTKSNGHPVTLQLQALHPNERVSITVHAPDGRLVRQYAPVADAAGTLSMLLTFAHQKAQGIYIVRVLLKHEILSAKVIIEK